jgi:hypothetical protein
MTPKKKGKNFGPEWMSWRFFENIDMRAASFGGDENSHLYNQGIMVEHQKTEYTKIVADTNQFRNSL